MKALSRLLIAAIGAAAFISCTQNGGLIYTNIQKTTKTNTSNSIPLDITVGDMVNTGSGTSPYYAAVGKIYNGTISNGSTSWAPMAVPQANGKDMLCNTLTLDGSGNLWGGFYSADGSIFGLYSSPPAPPGGNLVWTQLPTLNPGVQITYVNYVSSNLFVVAATFTNGNYVYELDYYNGSWTATNLTGLPKPITGVALVGSTYYVTSGNTLYYGTLLSNLTPAPQPSFNSNDILQGIFVDPLAGPLIIIPSSNPTSSTQGYGNIYWSVNGGGAWSTSSQQVSSYNVGFLCVGGPTDAGHTTYLLGTDSGTGGAFGFYSFVPSTNALNRFAGLSYSLYYSAVRRIMVDTTNGFVAMGTINNGLWVTAPIDISGNNYLNNTWTQE
jgi:hypothetical protein